MSTKFVTHPGYIRSISKGTAEVIIVTKSACASCEINGSCSVSDTAEKIIDVRLPESEEQYKVGQNVQVKMKQSSGVWAILFGYLFPFILLVTALVIFISLDFDQGIAGLMALAMLIPYYLVIYLFRNSFKASFDHSLV